MKKSSKVNNLNIGSAGENHAAAFLENLGFSVLHRNYRTKSGEIDIIAKKDGVIHIVEVKTSDQGSPIMPEENYTKSKSRQVLHMASLFSAHTNAADIPMQVDLIAVRLKDAGGVESLNYYERVTKGR